MGSDYKARIVERQGRGLAKCHSCLSAIIVHVVDFLEQFLGHEGAPPRISDFAAPFIDGDADEFSMTVVAARGG